MDANIFVFKFLFIHSLIAYLSHNIIYLFVYVYLIDKKMNI